MHCGVDEAGRGPIAGPVYAAAVVLGSPIDGLKDSKLLAAARREALGEAIREKARAWHVASASVEEIDRLNILGATLLAMQRAVEGLGVVPEEALIDGNRYPSLACPARCIVGGDLLHPAISAASILAKVARDAEMQRLHERFPQYGFDQHKGYATREHLDSLRRFGICEAHRRSFLPVRQMTLPL
jgi:ribonuclease HII